MLCFVGTPTAPVIIPPANSLRMEQFWNFTFECALFSISGNNVSDPLIPPDVTISVAGGSVYSVNQNILFSNDTQLYDVILQVGQYIYLLVKMLLQDPSMVLWSVCWWKRSEWPHNSSSNQQKRTEKTEKTADQQQIACLATLGSFISWRNGLEHLQLATTM